MTSGEADAQAASERVKAEYIRYQQLAGVPGVASCAPLISDGERLVLPISLPAGKRLIEWNVDEVERSAALTALRTFVSAAEQFEARELGYVTPAADRIFMDERGEITILASEDPSGASSTPRKRFVVWDVLKGAVKSTAIEQWFLDDQQGVFADLRFLIAAEFSGKPLQMRSCQVV